MSKKEVKNGEAETSLPENKITINGQFLKDFSFENPSILKVAIDPETKPRLDVNVEVHADNISDNTYVVDLQLRADSKYGDTTAIIIEIMYSGIFTVVESDKKELKKLLLIECPRLLYPFVRNMVSNISMESGYPPMILQPIDFNELFKQQEKTKGEKKS